MSKVKEIKIQPDGWIKIDPEDWQRMGCGDGKAKYILEEHKIILVPSHEKSMLPILKYMKQQITHKVTHQQAQQALSMIKGSLSQAVTEGREERI